MNARLVSPSQFSSIFSWVRTLCATSVMRRNEVKCRNLTVSRYKVTSKFSVRVNNKHVMGDAMAEPPFWLNPCGRSEPIGDVRLGEVPEEESIENILQVTAIAQGSINHMKNEFYTTIFPKEEFNDKKFRGAHYEWLPSRDEIPKELGVIVSQDHLQSLAFRIVLPKVYTNLQIIAAGMECVLKSPDNSKFKATITGHIRSILCEMEDAMLYGKIQLPAIVDREVVPEEFRNLDDQTSSKMRDWLVFREYMNMLEYVIEVFSFLQKS